MDESTEQAAEERALRHLLLDLENATRKQHEATRRQNQILSFLALILAVWSLLGLWALWKLDNLQFLTHVMH